MLNDQVKQAALDYATKLVAYHELRVHCETSDLHCDKMALRQANEDLYDAQNYLDSLCCSAV